jgi:glutathione peroxidase
VKSIILSLAIIAVLACMGFIASKTAGSMTPLRSFHELSVNGIDGKPIKFSDYKGKKILCVNVASKCGYTKQYEDLEALHKKYSGKLVVIGFPCNQFGEQEPGSNEEIVKFCKQSFGVTFPLTDKIDVSGINQHPVYEWLTSRELNGVMDTTVKWNFNKFLISENGELLGYYPSKVKPLDSVLVAAIEK